MGDNKKIKEAEEVKMVSVEQANAQMQSVVQQYNSKLQQLVAQVQQLDSMLRDRTIDHLFSVIKHSAYFDSNFVSECANAIEKYLTQVALAEPEQPQVSDVTPVTE